MTTIADRIPAKWQARVLRALFGLPKPVRALLAGRPVRRDGMVLDTDMGLMLAVVRLEGHTFGGGTVARARAAMERSAPAANGPVIRDVATRELTVPTPDGGVPARLYTPAGLAEGSPLLVFFHGGGWVVGSLDSHDNSCRFLAVQAGTRVLSVDYRLAPEHPFPAAVDDAIAAFGYAVEHAADLGADPAAVAVGGDSAGGNLAAVVCHQAALAGGPRPVFALLFYPGTDATSRRRSRELFKDGFFITDADMDWFADHYQPDQAARADPRFSVLLAEDISGFPPTYLATAGFDPLRDEGEEFARRLAAAGVPVVSRRHPGLLHGFLNYLGLGERSREAVAEAAGALRTGFALARARS